MTIREKVIGYTVVGGIILAAMAAVLRYALFNLHDAAGAQCQSVITQLAKTQTRVDDLENMLVRLEANFHQPVTEVYAQRAQAPDLQARVERLEQQFAEVSGPDVDPAVVNVPANHQTLVDVLQDRGVEPDSSANSASLAGIFSEERGSGQWGEANIARVRWTDLKPKQLAQKLLRRGYEIGRNTAAVLLDRAGHHRRSLRKELITGHVDPQERNQQFRHIDALRRQAHYPDVEEILLTFDAGGANAVRSLRFKEDLLALSQRLGVRLRIAHYPPYTSKWHPIEHRLFNQVERTWRGLIPDSPQTALETVQRTRTQTGLTVRARILDTVYELGRKCSDTFNDIKDRFIRHDEVLGKWNYVVDANGFT